MHVSIPMTVVYEKLKAWPHRANQAHVSTKSGMLATSYILDRKRVNPLLWNYIQPFAEEKH
jgi:hypothetical protein